MKGKFFHKNKLLAVLLIIIMFVTSIPMPIQTVQAASKKTVTISTQKQLEEALKNKKVLQINIKTVRAKTFTIATGDYSTKRIVITSPKAKVNNYAKIKTVVIKDAKKYMEYANDNNIRVEDTKLTLGIEKGASVNHLNMKVKAGNNKIVVRGSITKLSISAKEQNLKLSNHGKISKINVHQTADISIKGRTKENTKVNTAIVAENTKINSNVITKISAKSMIEAILNEGAENSSIKLKNSAEAIVNNKTTEKVIIEKEDGTKIEVEPGTILDTKEVSDVDKENENTDKDAEDSFNTENVYYPYYPSYGGGSSSIKPKLIKVTLNEKEISEEGIIIETGDTVVLVATVEPNGINQEVIWESSDVTKVTVENGKVTGIAETEEGKPVIITVKSKVDPTIVKEMKVTVIKKEETPEVKPEIKPQEIKVTLNEKEVSEERITIETGETVSLVAIVEPNGANQEVIWESSDATKATVENGKVTGVEETEEGKPVIITVKSKVDPTIVKEMKVTVIKKEEIPEVKPEIKPEVIKVTLNGKEVSEEGITIETGNNLTLIAILEPDGVNQEVIWESSDVTKATVENGKVTGIAGTEEGKPVIITVKSKVEETVTKDIKVTVTNKITYTVIFDSNGGNIVESQIVEEGESIIKPSEPIKDGYIFEGWYINEELTDSYDFSKKIISNIVLFAKWKDYQTDVTDLENDGVPDWVEQEFGTNSSIGDTDEDGLSDYNEIFILSSDPKKYDTDGNGISDADEDFDEDTISNFNELLNGTNPMSNDTDGDNLSDKKEIEIGTSPISSDTDKDGANDEWELSNGFDPLIFNADFDIKILPQEPTEEFPVTAGVELNINNTTQGVYVEAVTLEDNILSDIPGYLGTAYEFTTDGSFDNATISFQYDKSLGEISNEFQPRIYFFNEKDGILEELENQNISEGEISVQVSHFSTYILLNKVDVDAIWEVEIKPPLSQEQTNENDVLDIVFVIDYSKSMEWNDPNQLCKQLSKEFISKLRDEKDKAAIIKFIRKATVLSDLSSDKDILNVAIDDIVYDNGYGTYSGTDGSTGIKEALDCLSASDSNYQYVIFITDGEDNSYTYSYDTLIETANEMGITIFTVGMGSAIESVLKNIAEKTGGKYYHATTSVETENLIDLNEVFKDIESETVDLTTDTNNDGIPDYYNDLIEKGDLVLSTGSTMLSGINLNYNSKGELSDDWDNDYLKNGEEIKIIQNGNKVYIKMLSSPINEDTDGDGLIDKIDTEPMKKGKANGIIGELNLISCYDSENAGWTSGHVFLVYRSYIKDSIDFSTLTAGWNKKDIFEKWSLENLKEDNPLLSEYIVNIGDSVTIGNGAFGSGWFGIGDGSGSSGSLGETGGESSDSGVGDEKNGVCYNMETYKHLKNPLKYSYLANTYLSEDVTEEELKKLIDYFSQGSVNYWNLTHNCAEVACEGWNLICDKKVIPYNIEFLRGLVATPKGLKIHLRKMPESRENYSLADALNP